jgi:hypothetical protein
VCVGGACVCGEGGGRCMCIVCMDVWCVSACVGDTVWFTLWGACVFVCVRAPVLNLSQSHCHSQILSADLVTCLVHGGGVHIHLLLCILDLLHSDNVRH